MNLIKKELRLQQVTVTAGVGFCLCQIGVVEFINLAHPAFGDVYFEIPVLLFAWGASHHYRRRFGCGREELGASRLAPSRFRFPLQNNGASNAWLPSRSAFSWLCLLPLAWMMGEHWLCPLLSSEEQFSFGPLLMFGCFQMLVTAISIYASSVVANTLRATVLSIGLIVGFGVCVGLTARMLEWAH